MWFEAATPRTAGFSTVDTAGTTEASTLMTMVLMVIGAGSTSTAGGIKVTTFVTLLLATLAFFRSSGRIRAFGYSIGPQQAVRVMALLTISLAVLTVAAALLLATQEGNFVDITFEKGSGASWQGNAP